MPIISCAWEQRKFGDLYTKSKRKNVDLKYSVLDIISVAKMISSQNIRRSTDEYMKTYNIIKLNDIVFEGHTSKKYKYGRFVLNDFKNGIVSHVFDVFKPQEDMNPTFMKYYIHDESVMEHPLLFSTSHARMLNSLNAKQLNKQTIKMPYLYEQKKIGLLLNLADKIIVANQCQQKRRNLLNSRVFFKMLYKAS